jgi:hypothetical protein
LEIFQAEWQPVSVNPANNNTKTMGFSQIQIRELPTWVKVLQKSPDIKSKQDMLDELELIDDLLVLQKSQSLLTRKKNLKTQLEARIGKHLGHKFPNLNVK